VNGSTDIIPSRETRAYMHRSAAPPARSGLDTVREPLRGLGERFRRGATGDREVRYRRGATGDFGQTSAGARRLGL
jgi:hypothetical protein